MAVASCNNVNIKFPGDLTPCPTYEACTSLGQNILLGDDSADMSFIPYADDPGFDLVPHLEDYQSFSWQETTRDPDLEVIVIETAKRLQSRHGLSLKQIDEIEDPHLPLHPLQRGLGENGIIVNCHNRDFPPWPNGPSYPLDLYNPIYEGKGLKFKQKNMLQYFCPRRSCITSYCFIHLEHEGTTIHIPKRVPPLIKDDMLEAAIQHFCGQKCFLLGNSHSELEPSAEWTVTDQERLDILMKYTPDMAPCSLASICQKACNKVYQRRTQSQSDPIEKQIRHPLCSSTLQFSGMTSYYTEWNTPCFHDGPCTKESGCQCFQNKAYCESYCHCEQTCPQRFPGCRCTSNSRSKTICNVEKCLCYHNNRECDPDFCRNCGASLFIDTNVNTCRNVAMQMGYTKQTSVQKTKWGYGLYLEEPVKRKELIAEYIGELIYTPTAMSRGLLAHHRGRNYLFTLNDTVSIDSTYAGNTTRYINHSEDNPNCLAKILIVNGEHRIGIFAEQDIDTGEELFLDYGPEFFLQEPGAQQRSGPEGNNFADGPGPTPGPENITIWPVQDHSSDETYDDGEGTENHISE
ncbi:hypothetical protein AMATHDRAFT_142730 [Amanita thiersii Skay4041]|uniref:SET domain-containing protein n=1 Tax=Amanita thiersii Skay4041 TaxID=703135 RepID=A0A2A9NMP3_9AGAR|nr:hypothetical protein AMATHDRAFT_142730 [Amanita thiersii Skay4041]